MKRLFTGNKRLYLIIDPAYSARGLADTAAAAIDSGVRTIQLRVKDLPKKDIFGAAACLRKLTSKSRAILIINDHVDIALAVSADGVHLGQDDMPINEARRILGRNRIIGISTHNLRQARDAVKAGADYIGFGPVFKTGTKDAGLPKGIGALKKIKEKINIPVAAIGGITPENAPDVFRSGADAIAVISGILSGNIRTNTEKFLSVIRSSKK